MKLMSKLLLINWHYFSKELIEFDRLNFLTGKNGCGKSTIIDALQVILLGDTSGSFFNKAAGGRGGRSLKGYLFGELSDDEDGGFHSLRENERFTSYIAVQFIDTEKDKSFTAGCCFDVYSENDYTTTWFIYSDALPINGFVNKKIPMDSTALRLFLKEEFKGHHETTTTNKDFRDKLCGRLGGLRVERFRNLLKKAISFNPDVKIQDFISEFVCDEQQAVDVSPMQETIRSYKDLEKEADVLNERIELLDKIVSKHVKFMDAKDKEQEYAYLIERADTETKDNELTKQRESFESLIQELKQLNEKILSDETEKQKLENERDRLTVKLLNDKSELQLELIGQEIAQVELNISRTQKNFDLSRKMLYEVLRGWNRLVSELIHKTQNGNNPPNEMLASRINDLCESAQRFLVEMKKYADLDADIILSLDPNLILEINQIADSFSKESYSLNERISDEQKDLAKKKGELQEELQKLERGINPFPQDILDLKEAIISRLRLKNGFNAKVNIVAEASEVKDARWRNVIEGYLNTQKYYIIVSAEHFRDAIDVYNEIKTVGKIYNTGVVDIEKLRKKNPVCNANSLAEEIETSETDVRVFLDYVLGNVIKCDDVQRLREYGTAITDEGMLYKGFVVRAMNPKTWENPAIGQGAVKQKLISVKAEIAMLIETVADYADLKTVLSGASKLDTSRASEFERMVELSAEIKRIPEFESELATLRRNYNAIDTTEIDTLKKQVDDLKLKIESLSLSLKSESDKGGILKEKIRTLKEDVIPKLESELFALQAALKENYSAKWVEDKGDVRYERELSQRKDPIEISRAFVRELSGQRNKKESAWKDLVELRRDYNGKYQMGLPENIEDNTPFEDLWFELSDNSLPKYMSRISDAKNKAIEQFQEDFLSRLQNNIKTVKRQIDDLNNALKGSSFGDDTYRFKIIPEKTNERFYAMIMDEMYLTQGFTLMSGLFQEKYKIEIDELFKLITNEDGIGNYEKRVIEFTDYRTYLEFDLEVIHKDGTSERLSKTLSKKSGGETQTPFYIAVLASFAQLYRIGRDKSDKAARLIIFDEAFSKMDGERIARSVELLRKFGFQVILSAPSDKIPDISLLVDCNLLVYREGRSTRVGPFNPRLFEEIVYG